MPKKDEPQEIKDPREWAKVVVAGDVKGEPFRIEREVQGSRGERIYLINWPKCDSLESATNLARTASYTCVEKNHQRRKRLRRNEARIAS
jgi:hypothetical protein